MHVGKNGADSKSVVVFFPTAGDDRAVDDLSPVVLLDDARTRLWNQVHCGLGPARLPRRT